MPVHEMRARVTASALAQCLGQIAVFSKKCVCVCCEVNMMWCERSSTPPPNPILSLIVQGGGKEKRTLLAKSQLLRR